jgi:hypothetical protein
VVEEREDRVSLGLCPKPLSWKSSAVTAVMVVVLLCLLRARVCGVACSYLCREAGSLPTRPAGPLLFLLQPTVLAGPQVPD